ncbi:hypothetical protein ACVIRO_002632 [Rhizobium ruizarguesonis]
MNINLEGKIALVTGASRGIGYFTALELAKAGAHVIACARTVGGLEDLDDAIKAVGGTATLVPFDLADMNAIDALGGSIFERWGKLDILVANAGVLGVISPIGHIEAKVFEKVMTINVTATWRLIRSVDPLLARSDAGRAVILSSGCCPQVPPLLGRLLRFQGRRRSAGTHMGRREPKHTATGHQRRSGSDTHGDAGAGGARRRSADAAASLRRRKGDPAVAGAWGDRDGQAVHRPGEQARRLPAA